MPSELSFIPATVFRDGTPQRLNEEQEQLKREIYERMNPRRRKFVDRIGYDNWDPFQKPNDPLDVRLDVTKRTTQQLVREFLQLKAARNEQYGNDYGRGVLECALGIVNRDNEEAAQCRAKFPVPWSNIAFVHLQRGEPDKAITALKKALKWDPDFVQAKNALTTAYYMQGDFEACEKLCKEILEKEPAFAPAWNNMALAQFDLGKYAEARQSAAKAAELGFEVPEGFLEELKAKGV